ncbi:MULTISPECIES: YitT family protein [Exiguobacterium]|uniref:Putative integral inner membrane protein n=1 Tax=Exiguobacterium oxidotolerans TaxID=223958 RepID=A0A653I9X9_9BACL|nr:MULTISPECIES: YitT family protein [Exiguobacterium]VWX35939.1 putative integral inner membrane protein [Exiguobacterium oxidotolerans]
MTSTRQEVVRDYVYLLLGSLFVASAFSLFLAPNQLASGGVSGLSIVLNDLFGISPGLFQLVANVLLLAIGWMILGMGFGVKSLVGSIFLPVVILIYERFEVPAATMNPMLAAIFGGAGVGIGLGLIFKGRASTGGMDLIAQILHRFTKLPIHLCIALLDGTIVISAAIIFSLEIGLYALVALFITIKMIDIVQLGITNDKLAYIISDQREALVKEIFQTLDRGATEIEAAGAYTRKRKPMLMVVVRQGEITTLKEIVKHIDPEAFLVVSEAHEVLGLGFTDDKRYRNVP